VALLVHVLIKMFLVHDIPFRGTFARGVAIAVQYPACFGVRLVIELENVCHYPGDIQAHVIEVDFIVQFISFGKITDNETADVVDFISADFHRGQLGIKG